MPSQITNRREFLGTMAASTAAVATLPLAAATADTFGGFTVGAQSYTFRNFKLEPAVKRIKDAGLGYVEFYRGHVAPTATAEQINAVKNLCAEYGVVPVAFGVESFSKNHAANQRLFDFAKALGVKYLSADPDPDSFDSLDKLVEATGIGIAIHPHGPIGGGKLHRWYGSEVILPAVKDRHPGIGTCLDTGHLIRSAQLGKPLDPVKEILAMGARNFGLHLKDHDNSRKVDVVFGQGALDVAGILKALRAVDFKGYIAIEYEANADEPSADVRACVDYFKRTAMSL